MVRLLFCSMLALSLAGPLAAPLLAQEPKAASNPELKAYQVKVRDRVLEYWQPPDIDSDTRLQVLVRVDRDGKVSKREVKTLGDAPPAKAAEEAVLDAIGRAQPFPTVPPNVAPFYVEVRFNLKVAAKTLPTPKCYPVATFIDLPADQQPAVKSAITNLTGLLRDSVGEKEIFSVVDDRAKADLLIEASSDPTLARNDKTSFIGSYTVNEALTTGTARLGLKNRAGADLSSEQLSLNAMQLLGRSLGLPSAGGTADSIMSEARLAPRLTPEQLRIASDTVKGASCTAQTAQRGFQVKTADAGTK
ncbi:energy transducer TonB [Gloeobacter morelensis]|uniref:TonB C-terminal domain-containing protein n=1 Tax=Gloeobacter morelensis MG652769 TaxID=2781736 RepID=A0ABY3PHG5_9CYAN|nr:energy transducer TonB [Gloeobacter morelensis]UFP93121.1 TonB C-terminal domain-containing protein [Gloeobacter morelensis MG652769]